MSAKHLAEQGDAVHQWVMMDFKHIQKQYWGRYFWARGYFVASSGDVTEEAMAEYIRGQDGTEPSDGDDNFRVTSS